MYWINQNNPDMRGKCRAFYADTDSDVANLPTSTTKGVQQDDDITSCNTVSKGSSCLVIATSKYYVLNSDDEWTEL